jgi:hypothetical protein
MTRPRENSALKRLKTAFESGFFNGLESALKRLEKPLKNPIYSTT